MVQFRHTISKAEANYTYLNLVDDSGRPYGSDFPEHKSRLAIIDGRGRVTYAETNHGTRIWGSLDQWFRENDIRAGTAITVRYDPEERTHGLPSVHLVPEFSVASPTDTISTGRRRRRPERWETTVQRALRALGGQGSEVDILRWVQDGRVYLQHDWQVRALSALRDNGDGRGEGLFELASEDPRQWRLTESTGGSHAPGPRRNEDVRRLGRLIRKAALNPEAADVSALDCYLLAVVAYELEWYEEVINLVDQAITNGLPEAYRAKAEQFRSICSLKLEA